MLVTVYHGSMNRLEKTFRATPEQLGKTCYRAFVSLDVARRLNSDRQGFPVAVIGPMGDEIKAFIPYRSTDGGKTGTSVCIGTSLVWPNG